ncbi:g7133 [Coccomyxa viridis]|uniref:G7133 protein n=1 Tax=Coccomyxa viridis TaxID=1274662 RepID=A0ABP1FX35_9CHLO
MKPLLRAGAATAGTFVVIGGATLATTSVVMTVVRAGINHRKKKLSIVCKPCSGQKLVVCSVCKGDNLIDWSPFEDPAGRTPVLCPMCGGYGEQKCLNCNGEGTVIPLQLPAWASDAQ